MWTGGKLWSADLAAVDCNSTPKCCGSCGSEGSHLLGAPLQKQKHRRQTGWDSEAEFIPNIFQHHTKPNEINIISQQQTARLLSMTLVAKHHLGMECLESHNSKTGKHTSLFRPLEDSHVNPYTAFLVYDYVEVRWDFFNLPQEGSETQYTHLNT